VAEEEELHGVRGYLLRVIGEYLGIRNEELRTKNL